MFSDRIHRIKPSATLEMTSKAAELKRANKPVYNLSVGEPDFSTPNHIQKAAIWAINNGHTKYTPGGGTAELKEAVCDKLYSCLLYTSPSPRDVEESRMPSSA